MPSFASLLGLSSVAPASPHLPVQVTGSAHLGRATINCPFLKSPLDGFGGSVFFEDGQLRIEGLDARVGKRGRIHVGGVLPVHASKRRCAVLALCHLVHQAMPSSRRHSDGVMVTLPEALSLSAQANASAHCGGRGRQARRCDVRHHHGRQRPGTARAQCVQRCAVCMSSARAFANISCRSADPGCGLVYCATIRSLTPVHNAVGLTYLGMCDGA